MMQATVPVLLTFAAAPTNFRQRSAADDEAALAAIFNSFERWQTVRVIFQTLTFVATLWAIFVLG